MSELNGIDAFDAGKAEFTASLAACCFGWRT